MGHHQLLLKSLALFIALLIAGDAWAQSAAPTVNAEDIAVSPATPALPPGIPTGPSSTADHSKFPQLQRSFARGEDVTRVCLECHTEASDQVMHSIHWTWEREIEETGQTLGKRNVINSYCGSLTSNEPRCTSCHVGYGWEDDSFDFQDQSKVDCLICHDTTGSYWKPEDRAGHPGLEAGRWNGQMRDAVDLSFVAQHVGPTSRETCGSCHFYGGGADGVKHGDLDSSLVMPPFEVDVHMSPDGANMQCSDCHTFNSHQPSGSRYTPTAVDTHGLDLPHNDHDAASCVSCHSAAPHQQAKLNDHTDTLACQTCHIPAFARGGVATKTWWDWSQAGTRMAPDGSGLRETDEHGHVSYLSTKGEFRHGEDVPPDYAWFNGTVRFTLGTDTIDPQNIVDINPIEGSPDDGRSLIWPFKVMRGTQPYDTVHNTLLINHVFGADDTALWTNFDYVKSLEAGMEAAGLPYSGQFDFVETRMYWPITHMVAPKDQALGCADCHTEAGGRLEGIAGIYMPGRHHSTLLDRVGLFSVAFTGGFILLHVLGRMIGRRLTRTPGV